MKKTSIFSSIGGCIGMLILILDSKTALSGAKSGVVLILNTVIPSLFPFFFFSILLTGTAGGQGFRILRPFGKLFRIREKQEALLLPAFLGGYPAGAQAVCAAWRQNQLFKEEAERMLSFCSNAGPSFLFGILGQMFPELWMVWALWLIHLVGAVLAAWLFSGTQGSGSSVLQKKPMTIPQVMHSAMGVMANVCCWLLLFRILIAFLDRWIFWVLPDTGRVFAAGFLELANGCCALPEVTDIRLRFLLCSAMLSMGGICVFLQTRSVTDGLSLHWYCKGKLVQTLFSICASCALMFQNWIPGTIFGFYLAYLLIKKEKSSSIPLISGV